MAELFDFRTHMRRRRLSLFRRYAALVLVGLLAGGLAGLTLIALTNRAFWPEAPPPAALDCRAPYVTDGDTLRCGQTWVRLAGIDAPELPGHCEAGRVCTPGDPVASRESLRALVAAGPIQCRRIETDRFGRAVAHCMANGRDLSCDQVRAGQAVGRYGVIVCAD